MKSIQSLHNRAFAFSYYSWAARCASLHTHIGADNHLNTAKLKDQEKIRISPAFSKAPHFRPLLNTWMQAVLVAQDFVKQIIWISTAGDNKYLSSCIILTEIPWSNTHSVPNNGFEKVSRLMIYRKRQRQSTPIFYLNHEPSLHIHGFEASQD